MSAVSRIQYSGLRAILHAPDPVLCGFVNIPDPGVAAILGWSGLDVVVMDAEHAPFSLSSTRGCIDALVPTPAQAMVRVAANDPVAVKQVLDLGVDGVLFPMVNDAAEATAAVRACRYSPEGSRGVGCGPAAQYGAALEQYLEGANEKIAVIVMIETAAGVQNTEEIAAVEGLDGILVGPADLAADLGFLGQEDHPEVLRSITKVAEVASRAGTKVGAGCTPGGVGDLRQIGMGLFACYFDGEALGESVRAAVAKANHSWERPVP